MDYNGKQIINFQLSLFLYSLILVVITVPILLFTVFDNLSFSMVNECGWIIDQFTQGKITGIVVIAAVAALIMFTLKVIEFFLIIYASVKNSNGENYRYPLTINFIK